MTDKLIDTLNIMIRNSEPIHLDTFNQVIRCNDQLAEEEKSNDKIGLRYVDNSDPNSGWAISTLVL